MAGCVAVGAVRWLGPDLVNLNATADSLLADRRLKMAIVTLMHRKPRTITGPRYRKMGYRRTGLRSNSPTRMP